jgi:thiamine biosynthesis lipoprotein
MVMSRRKILKFAGALTLSPVFTACRAKQVPLLSGRTMGTRYSVQLEQIPKRISLSSLKKEIESVLENTESLMSLYRSDSELSLINDSDPGVWHVLSPSTLRVVKHGLKTMRLSGGAYNPASGPLVDYWGFGSQMRIAPPLQRQIPLEVMNSVGASAFDIDHEAIRKNHAESALNLNAIAKGDAVDQLAQVLERWGIPNFMVEIGGEFYARGSGPRGDRWRIGIEHPDGGILTAVSVDQQAVATSGDYVHFALDHGRRISHLMNPKTGKPISDRLALVSVVADSAIDADAWATALMVMGPDEGFRFALQHDMKAVFLKREAAEYKMLQTPRFKSVATMT